MLAEAIHEIALGPLLLFVVAMSVVALAFQALRRNRDVELEIKARSLSIQFRTRGGDGQSVNAAPTPGGTEDTSSAHHRT